MPFRCILFTALHQAGLRAMSVVVVVSRGDLLNYFYPITKVDSKLNLESTALRNLVDIKRCVLMDSKPHVAKFSV